ncbi:hypothetical protein [Rivibacter subsaxonicus]|nr:hypothetical protein [Rivibacter subsaxonicus]
MTALQAFFHALNLLLPGLLLGLIAAGLAKLLWRQALRGVALARLAAWGAGAAVLASLAGLVLVGRDGAMLTYLAMVLACAAALLVAGFGGRREA